MIDARLESYLSDTRRYDELLDRAGDVRTHWRPLIDALARDGADAVRRGVELARRLILENGVTYNWRETAPMPCGAASNWRAG